MRSVIGALFFVLLTAFLRAQPCEGYFPMNKGAKMETTNYNEKGKPQSVCSITIQNVETNGDEVTLTIHSDIVDKKNKQLASADYDAHCEKGSFFINMKSLITAEQLSAWKDMTVSMEADDIDYPIEYYAGQKLNDAHLKVNVSMNEMNMPGFSIDITDRVIEGKETITTPAGTFECIKVSSKQKVKNIISFEMRAVEWLSKGNGIIRSESFKGDKMKGYSLLTSLTK
jgi:hypothetical protein